MTVVVLGGYGVFGSLVCRELARRGVAVRVAGRDHQRAEALARELGPPHRAVPADASDVASCCAALEGARVAVGCAGPFFAVGRALLEACLASGRHYVDIADDREHAARVRALGPALRERALCAVYGASSLPGLSGALALAAREGIAEPPERARVTLFIGNDNPKGPAAVASLLGRLGRPIAAPQGILRVFRGRETVLLPPPFGRRAAFDIDSPEYDLFPDLLGVRRVNVKVGFELRVASLAIAILAWLRRPLAPHAAGALARLGSRLPRVGGSGGAVMTELFWGKGRVRCAAAVARHGGPAMAALPCALAAEALARGAGASGALTAYELLGPDLLAEVERMGYAVVRG